MIELRWLYDSRSDAHRVLQFRTLGTRMVEVPAFAGANGVMHTVIKPMTGWSEWQNVPETNGELPQGNTQEKP